MKHFFSFILVYFFSLQLLQATPCPYGESVKIKFNCQPTDSHLQMQSFEGEFVLDGNSTVESAKFSNIQSSTLCSYSAKKWQSVYLIKNEKNETTVKTAQSLDELSDVLRELQKFKIANWITKEMLIEPVLQINLDSLNQTERKSFILGFEEILDSKVGVFRDDYFSAMALLNAKDIRYKDFFYVTGSNCQFSFDTGTGDQPVGYIN